jgi:hypothetical protein
MSTAIAWALGGLLASATLFSASTAMARDRVDWSVTIGQPGYYPPPPVYAPPPSIMYPPPPVYVAPVPVYPRGPVIRYGQPYYDDPFAYGYQERQWREQQWREQQWREQQWREQQWREQQWREHQWRERQFRDRQQREEHWRDSQRQSDRYRR